MDKGDFLKFGKDFNFFKGKKKELDFGIDKSKFTEIFYKSG